MQYYVCGIWYRLFHVFMYGLMHGFFQQRPASHTLIHSVTHMVAAQHNRSLSVELCCRSCRGLIALLKGIIVINIDRRESVTHLLSLCQDYL